MQILVCHLLYKVNCYSGKLFPCIHFDLKVTVSECFIYILWPILSPVENNFKQKGKNMKSSFFSLTLEYLHNILRTCFFHCGFSLPFPNTAHIIFEGPQNASVGWLGYTFFIIRAKWKQSEVENKHFKEHAGFSCQGKTSTKKFKLWKKKKQTLCTLKMVCTTVVMKQKAWV